jgi:zinc protease
MRFQLVEAIHTPLLVEKYKFDHGLTLLYHPDHQTQLLSYQTWFRVGSSDEDLGKTGLAHLFEHLMFKSTKNHPAGEFERILGELGGQVNAATYLDWTYYHEELPSQHLLKVIELEADRMQFLDLNQSQLKTEKKVVLNERQEGYEDDPTTEMLWQMAFEDHPYGHPTIGWQADIENFKLKDCKHFYQTNYAVNQAIIVVSGDVQRDFLLHAIDRYYGHLKPQPIPDRKSVAPRTWQGPKSQTCQLDISSERLIIGIISPDAADDQSLALDLFNQVFVDLDSSRLYQKLFFELECVSRLNHYVPQFRGPGLYEINCDLNGKMSLSEVEKVIFDEIQKVADFGVTEEELEKGKNCLEIEMYQDLQTLEQKSEALGFWETTLGDFKEILNRPEKIRKLTREAVQGVARSLLDTRKRFVIYAQPKGED